MTFEWELIFDGAYDHTYRAKVIGGWLVRHRDHWGDNEVSTPMTFIPDAQHEWEIE